MYRYYLEKSTGIVYHYFMTSDQLVTQLRSIEDTLVDFTVVFTGKQNKRMHGIYKPDTREICINERNFVSDNLLLYTAIHEYAHHLHAVAHGGNLPLRSHNSEFMAILHRLLHTAESKGLYQNVFAGSPELTEVTEIIRDRLSGNGQTLKELGMLLSRAYDLCTTIGGRFEDYIDRVLNIPRQTATMAMKVHQYDLNPKLGSDNMRFLAGINDQEERNHAETELLEGKSTDTVRQNTRQVHTEAPAPQSEPAPVSIERPRLEREKLRLERAIDLLSKRLEEVNQALESN
jgi:hypothetical protein